MSRSFGARVRNRAFHLWFLVRRPMTLGARVAIIDGDRIVLIRHTYVPGWHLPGGGVDPGETLAEAARRECAEEAGYETGPLELIQIYKNNHASRRDHVALFRAIRAEPIAGFVRDAREIAEIGLFPMTDLPDDATQATRRRVAELTGKTPASEFW